MGRKEVIGVIICLLLLFLTPYLVNLIFPPIELPDQPDRSTESAQKEAQSSIAATATNVETIAETRTASLLPAPNARPEEKRVQWQLSRRILDLTSIGGGIAEVHLTDYPAQISCHKEKTLSNSLAHPYVSLNQNAPLPILTLLAGTNLPPTLPYELRLETNKAMLRAQTEQLEVLKIIEPSTNNLVRVKIQVRNCSTNTLHLPEQQLIIGTAMPPNNRRDLNFLGLQWYDGAKVKFVGESWFANRTLGCFPGRPRQLFRSDGMSNVVWAAVQTRFFTIIAREPQPAPQVMAQQFTTTITEDGSIAPTPAHAYTAALVHPEAILHPGASLTYEVEFYFGPKEYKTLAALGKDEDLAMNFTTFFGWFARALLLSMNGLHALGLPYGLAIIAITIMIKLLFWPLTAASARSMKRMAALQPQMKAIQEKYKDDPKKMNEKLMQFMRENRVNPLGGCLPILIQIPVFIGFYQMLQSAIELRGARFLWICDLSQPDTVAELLGFPINPLPLIMGATQYWQARLTPPSPGADPVQQKLIQYMPLLFILILYNFPSGLALYWTVQNLLTILQTKLTRADNGAPASVRTGKSTGPNIPPTTQHGKKK